MAYNYNLFCNELKKMPNLKLFSFGKSLTGRELFCIKYGSGRRTLLISAAFHGTEWITSMVLMEFIKSLSQQSFADNSDDICLYLVPMLNPDGIEIHIGKDKPQIEYPSFEYGKEIYWQANARGVDLNHNFDAAWASYKSAEAENKIFAPGPTRFSGTAPESEPESRALADLVRRINPEMVMALHSQGEVIYYDFNGFVPEGSAELVKKMVSVSGYSPETPEQIASSGGFKDWFIDAFKRPGFTIEVGKGTNPLPESDLSGICEKVIPLIYEFCYFR